MQTRCNSVYYVNVPGDVFVRVSSAFHEAFWRRQVSKTWLKECQDNWIQRRPAMLCTTVVKDHYLLFLRSLLEVSVLKLNKESTFFSLVKFDNKLILFIFSKKKPSLSNTIGRLLLVSMNCCETSTQTVFPHVLRDITFVYWLSLKCFRQQLFLQWSGPKLPGNKIGNGQFVHVPAVGHSDSPQALLQRTGLSGPSTSGQLLSDNKRRRQTLVLHNGQRQTLGALQHQQL